MRKKIFLVECEDKKFADIDSDKNLYEIIEQTFKRGKKFNEIEFIVLNDEYMNYLSKNNLKDNLYERSEYNKKFPNSFTKLSKTSFGTLVDLAYLPFISNAKKDGILIHKISKKACKDICLSLSNFLYPKTIKTIKIPNFFVKKEYLDTEIGSEILIDDLVNETNNFEKQYEDFIKKETENILMDTFYLPVIAYTKLPEIITREDYKHFCLEDFIIEFNFDVEKILKIIEEEFGEDVDIAPFTNGLIYPEHKDDLIDNLTEHLITLSFDNIEKVNKLNSLTAMHTKKKKGKK